ncbi:hypothetical protein CAL26_01315 [Bordetella genomosp. 9]|uniref:site-specific DNA-methyltransferase (adenine-specific) n=2 Tax=Bordetella TaxID=517 RepID=A0A261RMX7_9BORD|nr:MULTISPECIES: N-6 DNA methylase [Bordetella]ARP82934.1 hypothetical protein CAL12_20350 [Bordetella genomosp. 8]OZI26022.1 hypothetical protein CAL26_01315 [Bordetella genomosp. 9]
MAKTSKAQQRRFFNSADEHQKAIVEILRELSRTHGLDRTWSDWTEMSALALANAVDRAQFERREKRYLEIVGHYHKEDLQQLAKAFAHLVQCWEQRVAAGEFGDVLGSTFMMLDMGNSGTGQFFTPYEVSRLMGAIIMGDEHDLASEVGRRGFLRLMEPACGAGGMIISAAHALHDARINYQRAMHVIAIDIDLRCVHMAYLQLALLHIPAIVVHGNALGVEEWEQWYTPAHILGGWTGRLRRRETEDAALALLVTPAGEAAVLPASPGEVAASPAMSRAAGRAAAAGQMTLF